MILIDALYINNSGGKVLLDYLMMELEESNIQIYYLLDKRIELNHIPVKSSNKVNFIRSSFLRRHQFYMQNKKSFNKTFCFASLPPSIKIESEVYTYFQQLLYLRVTEENSFVNKFIISIKSRISRYLKKNTNFWIVQSDSVKGSLSSRYKINTDKIFTIPFFPPLISEHFTVKESNKFLYVSEGHPHKNHVRLIDAFSIFYRQYHTGELHLTVSFENLYLCDKINNLKNSGIPIINHGFQKREMLIQLYQTSEFLVYPSLAESFGLGIIEGIENGCTIIGADLPYMYSACEPSVVFDPKSVNDIAKAFEKAIYKDFKPSRQLLFNEINKLIELLAS